MSLTEVVDEKVGQDETSLHSKGKRFCDSIVILRGFSGEPIQFAPGRLESLLVSYTSLHDALFPLYDIVGEAMDVPSRFVRPFLRHARLCLEVPEIGKGSPVSCTPPPR